MATITKRIGLSLGADICWPICYEEILKRLDLRIPMGGDTIRFEVDRVHIEPFKLVPSQHYDVVLDRLTHWYHTSREWIKKSIIMDGLYVFNNPWSVQSMEKQTSYSAMLDLGLPVPETWILPPKEYEESVDLQSTLEQYARMFDLGEIGGQVGYPLFMKPYDGGAWVGVTKIDDEEQLRKAYDESGRRVMHLQKSVLPHDLFVRCIGVGPQTYLVKYDPSASLHERYQVAFDFLGSEEAGLIHDMTLTINSFFGWDFNSCETLRQDGTLYPIDFANPCPDSQVTSLHYHFPWLVKAKLKWSLFCAATGKKMRPNLDWSPFHAIRDRELPYREMLAACAGVANERYETDRFNEFCQEHLADLDRVSLEFFASDCARDAVGRKVAALFPAEEVEKYTEHFWGLIEFWRKTEADRMDSGKGEAG
ncbi:MAG: hypothetical protein IFK94_11335 [Acidobacteria bacterium]|uniref:ATP-grasp domain-containing protein n=1 Tax=Candidatus Polarisedimenticola svalbardensis TaxID=2886004 RepID=A0A8J6Y1K6_9BACT|nr:hypothetical protein [Candidatus Polarisedimenticola svalbardensis]